MSGANCLVDTNVLVYFRDASEPGKQAKAAAWLAALWRTKAGRISTQVLSEDAQTFAGVQVVNPFAHEPGMVLDPLR